MVLAVVVLIGVVWLVRGSGGNDPTTASGPGVSTSGTNRVTSTTTTGPQLTGDLGSSAPASLTGVLADDPTAGSGTAAATGPASSGTEDTWVSGTASTRAPSTDPASTGPASTGAANTGPANTGTSAPTAGTAPTALDPVAQGSAELEAQKSREAELKDAQQQAEAAAEAAEKKVAEVKAKIAAEAAKEKAAKEKAAKEKAAADAAAAELASRKYDPQGQLICPPSFVKATAVMASRSVAVGTKPELGVSVQNVGDQSCVQDVSGSTQQFTVLGKAGAHIWSTQDCFPGTGTELRVLQPGEAVQYSVIWAGTTSSPGCVGARTPVPAGGYTLQAQVAGVKAPNLPFTVVAP
ncbi:hypothetical protein D1871_19940 [Nakamurella silvestris]|nr:hypothetical protein D1871_19940 [Nakamurella silvestris]